MEGERTKGGSGPGQERYRARLATLTISSGVGKERSSL